MSLHAHCILIALHVVRLLIQVVVGARGRLTANVCQGMEQIPLLVTATHGSLITA